MIVRKLRLLINVTDISSLCDRGATGQETLEAHLGPKPLVTAMDAETLVN
jgi:hypothetical protein